MSVAISIISAVIALVAVIVGPMVTWRVAKKQITASVVSNNRQAWINRLRDEVASLTAITYSLPSTHANKSISTDDAISEHARFVRTMQTVKLLINPAEEDHKRLIELAESASNEITKSINKGHANASQFEDMAQAMVEQTQQILKREWERVKVGD